MGCSYPFIMTPERLERELKALQRRYPDMLKVSVIGRTYEGRPIFAARAGGKDAKLHILIHAGIHGREHMTALLALRQLARILRRGVPEGVAVHFIPMVNPDGAAISQTKRGGPQTAAICRADIARGDFTGPPRTCLRLWKANAAGVDLNRNFNAGWERIDTRPAPSFANYRGPAPLSEPESRALAAYAARLPLAATISYHAAGEEIYYEFGDRAAVNAAGLELARAVARETGYTLLPDDGTSFGGFKDWAIEKLGVPSLTIEIGQGNAPLPLCEFSHVWKKNKDVPLLVAEFTKLQSQTKDAGALPLHPGETSKLP